jgi:hypothetical protein
MWYGKNDDRQDEACRIEPELQKYLIDRAVSSYARLIRLAEIQQLENMFFDSLEKDSISDAKNNISKAIQKVLDTK